MNIDFSKYHDGLVPTIVQDNETGKVLMLGFMNEEAVSLTHKTGKVTFYSRSRKALWTKGETSGNFLLLKEMLHDCDEDTLLVKAMPIGPTCHTGADTCFGETNQLDILSRLETVINDRYQNRSEESYTSRLFDKGINKIAQKVGEEAVELVIEAKDDNENLFLNEAADLLFHYLILLKAKGYSLESVKQILLERHLK